jgi:hypothetical protein
MAKFKALLPAHNEPDSPTNKDDKKAMRKAGKNKAAK